MSIGEAPWAAEATAPANRMTDREAWSERAGSYFLKAVNWRQT
jgi:hypothetical protein